MKSINDRLKEIFEQFEAFPPKKSIVRKNQENDAFAILTFEILFRSYHQIDEFSFDVTNHRNLLVNSIVPPPDDSIDIFFEEKELDENTYHVVQVKISI